MDQATKIGSEIRQALLDVTQDTAAVSLYLGK